MGSKQIMVQEWIYNELDRFRDDKGLKSFTDAIRELLKFYRESTGKWLFEKTVNIDTPTGLPVEHTAISPVSTDTEVSCWEK